MEAKEKLFAFKLVAKESEPRKDEGKKWVAREGVATAGCTEVAWGDYRCSTTWSGEGGAYC